MCVGHVTLYVYFRNTDIEPEVTCRSDVHRSDVHVTSVKNEGTKMGNEHPRNGK